MKKLITLIAGLFLITNVYANSVHYIIDTDMGFDDWMAVLYLLKQPVAVDGITIDCQGETYCPEGAINAAKLTHLAKRDVPIVAGNVTPATTHPFPRAIRDFASDMKVPNFTNVKADADIQSISAAQFILDATIQAAKKHEKVMIISIGTATNIADAWKLAEKNHQVKLFREGLGMIYKGGGAFGDVKNNQLTNQHIPGNISIPGLMQSNNTVAEWNIYANAPAMQTVVQANLPITFIPLNACKAVPMTQKRYDELLKNSVTNRIDHFDANALYTLVPNGNWHHMQGMEFWDTAATVAALHPHIVTKKFTHVPLDILLKNNDDYGATWITKNSSHFVTVDDRLNKKEFYDCLLGSM